MSLFEQPDGVTSHWISFENPQAIRNAGGKSNKGSKGCAFEIIEPGETKVLMDEAGSGVVTRMWMALPNRTPLRLRSLRIRMYWEGAERPAVDCPVPDFFGIAHGRCLPFESALFSNPEGRNFHSLVPMPFHKNARITVTNESEHRLDPFLYEIDLNMNVRHGDGMRYFHSHWRRELSNRLGEEFDILPRIEGRGRFLGCNIGVIVNPIYGKAWWGEGEVKVRLGDDCFPSLCGTGAEDYVGTSWGLGPFFNATQGCPLVDQKLNQFSMYRFHLHDPVFFEDACRVSIQTIGGSRKPHVIELLEQGVPLIPVTVASRVAPFCRLLDSDPPLSLGDPKVTDDGWCNFWRQDDWCATAYFYLNTPDSALPALPSIEIRCAGLRDEDPNASFRADE